LERFVGQGPEGAFERSFDQAGGGEQGVAEGEFEKSFAQVGGGEQGVVGGEFERSFGWAGVGRLVGQVEEIGKLVGGREVCKWAGQEYGSPSRRQGGIDMWVEGQGEIGRWVEGRGEKPQLLVRT
jgi:hypothetical protein